MESSPSTFTANVEPPLLLAAGDDGRWDEEADLVVVGFGGAGVVAALQARELGADVIAVDRFEGGGATAKSGGVIYAGGTRHQKAAGFDDDARQMFDYLANEGTPVRSETLRRFCDDSASDVEWLEGHGVRFGHTAYLERIAYPPDGYFLYYTGMEKFRSFAKPAPRGHRTVGKGATGSVYYAPLKASALARGIRFLPHAPVRRL
ncbi:MAG TPA: FAD-dependent oxidoreductase, partial [Nevskiaceae bacterium]|nr:FAD-dependent oxidoreductase [Nevskiaceae bacterium]